MLFAVRLLSINQGTDLSSGISTTTPVVLQDLAFNGLRKLKATFMPAEDFIMKFSEQLAKAQLARN